MTHICVSKLTIIGSDNGLSPGRRQAIIWTNAGILLIGPLGTNFNETSIEIHTFSFKKIHLKLSSGKWRPFCLGLNVLSQHLPGYQHQALVAISVIPVHWRHNDHSGVSNHQPHDCLPNRLFRRRSKKTSKLRVTGLCVGNSPGTGEFPAQRASNEENYSIWWRHHAHGKSDLEEVCLVTFFFFTHYGNAINVSWEGTVDFFLEPNNAPVQAIGYYAQGYIPPFTYLLCVSWYCTQLSHVCCIGLCHDKRTISVYLIGTW